MSQLFACTGQSIGVSASASVLPMNTQTGLPQDGLFGSSCSIRDTRESSPTPQFKSINSLVLSLLHSPILTSIHDYWKNHSLDRWTFVGKVTSLLLNMLSRLVITFLPRSKRLLISWLQSPSAVVLEPPKIKSDTRQVYLSIHFVLRQIIKRRLGSDTRELLQDTYPLQLSLTLVLHLFPNQSLQPWLW